MALDVPHQATDLTVTLPEDRPGMLAKAIDAIGSAGIDIEGYAEMEGVVHILTSDLAATRRALDQAKFQVVKEQPVVVVSVEDRPGSAAHVFRRIADAKINLRFSYLASRNRLVIGADDLRAVLTTLGS
jgi:hypothetical protein